MKIGLLVFTCFSFLMVLATVLIFMPLVSGFSANSLEASLIETRIQAAVARQASVDFPLVTVHTRDEFYGILEETARLYTCFFLEQTFFLAERRTTFLLDGNKIYETNIRAILEGDLYRVLEYLNFLVKSELGIRELSITSRSQTVLEVWISVFHDG